MTRRPPFMLLAQLLRLAHVRARLAGQRRGPNKHGRHFHVLTADLLHARRLGINPRVLRGAGE